MALAKFASKRLNHSHAATARANRACHAPIVAPRSVANPTRVVKMLPT
jgi:hypothetical protein